MELVDKIKVELNELLQLRIWERKVMKEIGIEEMPDFQFEQNIWACS